MNDCTALCVAKNFSFGPLRKMLPEHYPCSIYRDVLHITQDSGDVFVFSYGALVAWGTSAEDLKRILHTIKPFEQGSFQDHFSDEFTYSVTGSSTVRDDHISLASDDPLEKLAVSHGIAQSVKLEEFETSAEKTIEETAKIPLNLAASGKTHLSRKQISKMRGNLFLVTSDINLRYNLLDTPDFFWEYPEVEHAYEMMARYLDITPRIEILNQKIDVIHELFSMLAQEQYHKHSSTLEWIIILLIAVEIVFFLIHDIFNIF
ncbi:MAG: RMD1 family protein [Deltaproteobacteria bacterium]|nr:RMD1 family protein [Deltaproteobacteria bacterium]